MVHKAALPVQVVSIDGQATIGWNGDQAAQLLRGRSGSSVIVRLARRTLAVPGVPARPEPPLPKTEYRQVSSLTHACGLVPGHCMLTAEALKVFAPVPALQMC